MKYSSIDEYLAKAKPFAQIILSHIRALVHEACPEVQETIKWSFPHFEYKGTLCAMAAFKEHCTFGFWKEQIMKDPYGAFHRADSAAMGHFGRIAKIEDLPADEILLAYIKEAIELNEKGIKLPKKISIKKELSIPDFFMDEIKKNKEAVAVFQNFSTSKQKEYVEWVTEAKQDITRQKRLATTILWLSEGKSRNWKYQNC